jgi:hypothetical protein
VKTIRDVVPTLMGDPQLRAPQRQARLRDGDRRGGQRRAALPGRRGEGRLELAQSFIHRHVPAVQLNAGRIRGGDASRIARYDKILGLSADPA